MPQIDKKSRYLVSHRDSEYEPIEQKLIKTGANY